MTNNEINATKRTDIYNIDPRNVVVVDGFNVRRDFDINELKEQIKLQGVLNPITVVPFKDDNGNDKYKLVDGERRLRATLQAIKEGADIKRIKALFLPRNTKEEDLLIEQMMRNEGKNFTEYEQALMFQRFRDKFGYTQTEIAQKFGKSVTFIGNCLSLLYLAPQIQDKLANNEISTSAVRQIVGLKKDDEKAQIEAVNNAISEAKEHGKEKATIKHITGETKSQREFKTVYKGISTLFFSLKKDNLEEKVMNMTVRDLISCMDCSQSVDDVLAKLSSISK